MLSTISFVDALGHVHATATIFRNPTSMIREHVISGTAAIGAMMEGLRCLPFNDMIVSMTYPAVAGGSQTILNLPEGGNMDLAFHLSANESAKDKSLEARLVAPTPNVIPDDGTIDFVVVESILDVINAPKQSVLLFDDHNMELLECIVKYSDLFGMSLAVLSGVPSAEYGQQFESKTYSLERVSFASLVNEIIERKRVDAALVDETKTSYDREREQFTRKSGEVKELSDVKLETIVTDPKKPGRPDVVESLDGVFD